MFHLQFPESTLFSFVNTRTFTAFGHWGPFTFCMAFSRTLARAPGSSLQRFNTLEFATHFFLAAPDSMWDLTSMNRELNPCPLCWECEIQATGPPGKSCNFILNGCLGYSQFSSVAQSCPTLCDPMNRSTPGLPVHHKLPEFTQTHAH